MPLARVSESSARVPAWPSPVPDLYRRDTPQLRMDLPPKESRSRQEPDRTLLSSKEPMRRAVPVALVLLLVGTDCSLVTGTGGGQDANSGIRGVVLLGPMCPVGRVGSPCPDRPIAAVVRVSGSQGEATVRSGS